MDCVKCENPISYSGKAGQVIFNNVTVIHVPGFECDQCNLLIIDAYYGFAFKETFDKNKKSLEKRKMECSDCLQKMEYISDLYVLYRSQKEEFFLPGYLCQNCENQKQHPWTVDFIKNLNPV